MLTSSIAYIALSICLAGSLWRISGWFRSDLGPESDESSSRQRLAAAGKALLALGFSAKLFRLITTLLWEVVFQSHLLRQNRRRWAGHMALCYGFLLLVVMHALDDWTAPYLFADYAPTLDPFRWWRNLLAVLVVAGVLVMAIRKRAPTSGIRTRSWGDRLILMLVAVIIGSGIMLESAQILSATVFDEMVEDYMGHDDPEDVTALQQFWGAEFGAYRQPHPPVADASGLAYGQEVHEAYCAACHSRPQSAFLSYPTSRLLKPVAGFMDTHRIDLWLWALHYLASCLALACLPFSKFFHLIATPVNLLARATGSVVAGQPALRPTRRAIGMDACTHCGICTTHCAVAPIYRVIPNTNILPSEKLRGVRRLAADRSPSAEMTVLAEGSLICTLCGRCTRLCPSGIELQDLWQASCQDLMHRGYHLLDGRSPFRSGTEIVAQPTESEDAPPNSLGLTDRPETFWACVQCTTCTSVCPVVAASDDPQANLDLTPQQIMNLMRLQLRDQALGCRMLWDCVTCYKCQEHCPQDVKVADVLYELRNEAYRRRMQSISLGVSDNAQQDHRLIPAGQATGTDHDG